MKKKLKERILAWLYPEQIEKMEKYIAEDNMKNHTEFIEKAVDFYLGYLQKDNNVEYLSKILLGAISGTIKETENRQSANIFRLAVEMSMMMNLIAWKLDISDEELQKLRARCSSEVKNSKGKISFENALEYQRN